MTASKLAEYVLLSAGAAVIALSCLGVLSGKTALDKLHFTGPAAVLGIPLIATAIVVSDGFTTSGTTACLVALTVLLLSPFSTHFLGRAIRVREFGRWVVLPAERANQQSEGHD